MKGSRTNRKALWLIVLLITSINTVSAQKNDILKGDQEYFKKHYRNALNYYKKASSKATNLPEKTIANMADSYYHVSNYDLAIQYYSQVSIDGLTLPQYSNYGKALQFNKQYKSAKEIFKKLLEKDFQNSLTANNIQSCDYSIEKHDPSSEYDVEKTDLNTYGESFGVQFYKNGIVYATIIDTAKDYISGYDKVDRNGNPFKDLGFSEFNNGEFKKPMLFSKHLAFNHHEGSICFSADNKTMYFTETVKIKGNIILQIFQVEFIHNKWKNKRALSFNSDKYSCAHPSISSDGKQLFFTSNMPDGYGGKDLYVSIREGDVWEKPTNLGQEVNTAGEEMFPFINKNGVLYFSSDGHPGYGGLDIYSALYFHNKWAKVTNKKKPLNSSGDDFSIAVDPTNENFLLFSSNRETQGNQDFIYKAIKMDLSVRADTIKGVIRDDLTEEPQLEVLIFAFDDPAFGDTLARTITNNKGEFSIIVPKKDESTADRNLFLVVDKNGYERRMIDIDNSYFETEKPLFQDLNIELKGELTEDKVIKFYNMYFDFGSAKLNVKTKTVLNRVALMLKENREIKIELSAHTDSRSDVDFNLELSKKRAENARKYVLSKNIDAEHIYATGYGELKLLNHCEDGVQCDESEHAVNRRIEIKILKR